MTLKERLDLIINTLGLSGRAFEKSCGLSNGSYSSIGDGVGADKLNKILFTYPEISADWLISGRGEMFNKSDVVKNDNISISSSGKIRRTGEVARNKDGESDLFRLTNMLTSHQANTMRLIAEIERNGQRFDRVLTIIENRQPEN